MKYICIYIFFKLKTSKFIYIFFLIKIYIYIYIYIFIYIYLFIKFKIEKNEEKIAKQKAQKKRNSLNAKELLSEKSRNAVNLYGFTVKVLN